MVAAIGLPHAENVATLAPWDVTNHDHATFEMTETDDASLAIVLARVFNLHRNTVKNDCGVGKVQARSTKVLARLAGSQVMRMG